ncbi:MAG: prepilin peptidase [Campylobacter sp.]
MIILCFFIFGLVFGSFGNVLIHRLPLKKSILYPSSHCVSCKEKLKFYYNIPIFSWIFLRGKCAFCNTKISIIYPFTELFSAFLAVLAIYTQSDFCQNLDTKIVIKSVILTLSFINLLCLSIIDIAYKAVPDALLFAGLIFAILYSLSFEGIVCMAVFMSIFWLLRLVVSKAKNTEAMGLADVFIVGIIGAILGYLLGFMAIYLAAILTLPFYVKNKNLKLPFVPFLSLGLLITYIFKTEILILIGKFYE